MSHSASLIELLYLIRGHASFKELLQAVETPRISPFRPSDAAKPEESRAKWILESGKLANHENWIAMLTGNSTSEQENR